MIVCHCNRIDHRDIEQAANALSDADPWQLITPVTVYKALGKRPRCGGCLSLATNIIHPRSVCSVTSNGVCPFADPAIAEENSAATESSVAPDQRSAPAFDAPTPQTFSLETVD